MNEKTAKDLFGYISDFEGTTIEFERIKNLIQVYSENMEQEVEALREVAPDSARYFLNRCGILQSQLEAIEILFNQALSQARRYVKEGYADVMIQQANGTL